MLKSLIDFLYPPVCEVCGVLLPSDARPSRIGANFFCTECDPELDSHVFLPRFTCKSSNSSERLIFCDRCGDFLPAFDPGASSCSLCAILPLVADRVRSALRYTEPVERALKAYKYSGRRHLARYFASVLMPQALALADPSGAQGRAFQAIVPLPSSRASQIQRGYHHTLLIAADLARQAGVPMLRFALRSVGKRSPQALLSPDKRARNMCDAFTVDRRQIEGKCILVVDDLLTSGASINEAARVLKAGGAGRVDALTVARSRHFTRNRVLLALQTNSSPANKEI